MYLEIVPSYYFKLKVGKRCWSTTMLPYSDYRLQFTIVNKESVGLPVYSNSLMSAK